MNTEKEAQQPVTSIDTAMADTWACLPTYLITSLQFFTAGKTVDWRYR